MDDERVVKVVKGFFSSLHEGLAALAIDPSAIHARTSLGETPLHFLCVENQIDAVQALIQRGADVNTVNEVGSTPLSDACSLAYLDLVRLLLASDAVLWLDGQHDPTLHQAVRGGDVEIVRLILDAGANVNELADLSEAPLHLAVEDDKVEIAELLLARGADPALKRIFDESALDVALLHGSERCLALLSTRH
ncbi:ankyrin repeat domain-containing protein [Roseateles sp.]|uniref:ankyrin repeat domain-containing protein n=1 Tax=Roseateles sp. TaxID=1971397 RepID=UPI00359F9F7E